jgi:hypothetical protein
MRGRTVAALALALALLGVPVPSPAQTRELRWRALDIDAALTGDGRLQVRERHAMVFTGDWNGGERDFDLDQGESLAFHRLSRIGGAGPVVLRENQPPGLDEYAWGAGHTLRWRSRRPTDPPFQDQEIVYVLEYTIAGVLRGDGDGYRFHYDFGVPRRAGPIEQLTVDLRLPPELQPLDAASARYVAGPLAPGRSYFVTLRLRSAPGAPPPLLAGERRTPAIAWTIPVAVALLAAVRLALFWRRERASGRLEPLPPAGAIDERWLNEHVLSVPAEVVGAVWDRSIGPPEVAATLARLEAEGKIETWANATAPSRRHLRLKVAPTALRGHERLLLDALLLGGTETDTDAIQRHYATSGFDPVQVIDDMLEQEVRQVLGRDRRPPILPGVVIGILLLAGIGGLVRALVAAGDALPLLWAAVLLVPFLVGLVCAHVWRVRVGGGSWTAAGFLVPAAVLVAAVLLAARWGVGADPLALAGLGAIAIAMVEGLLAMAATRESPAAMRVRKRLAAAERHLRRALRERSTAIRPEWFPHLLALGLAEDAQRWSAARPRQEGGVGTAWPDDGERRAGSGSASPAGFSGGGGRFGGGGASGSWAAAAHAFSASVAAPSSSGSSGGDSSGSSSSSSSSSSGGGGAGGW